MGQKAAVRSQRAAKLHSVQFSASGALEIPREEATHGKRCLQAAHEVVSRVKSSMPPGNNSCELEQALRMICVGITVLRDSDVTGTGVYGDGVRVPKIRREEAPVECKAPNVECPKCGHRFHSKAENFTMCGTCKKQFRVASNRFDGGAA